MVKVNKIGAYKRIKATNGKIFSAFFRKKDGSLRKMVHQVESIVYVKIVIINSPRPDQSWSDPAVSVNEPSASRKRTNSNRAGQTQPTV